MNLEESMNTLKEICSRLTRENLSLDETVKLYKEGMALSDSCLKMISDIRTELGVDSDEKDGQHE